ncbi:MAG: glycosyltransferase family 4 protein [Microcoleaceae cyanobacterium]
MIPKKQRGDSYKQWVKEHRTIAMKVLHINQADILGGAAIAAYRLHEGLLGQGIDSKMLAGTVASRSNRVAATPRKKFLDKLTGRVTRQFGLNYINHVGTWEIFNHPFYQEADVLHFHNLHKEYYYGYFNYLALPSLTKEKPAVFTLHDMWSFTGHCSYSYDCDRWQTGCGSCPYLDTYPAVQRDGTQWEWKLKNWAYRHANLIIATDSRWLAEEAQKSMLGGFSINHVPYGLDTEIYRPHDPNTCKHMLGISPEKKVLIFAATSLKERRKGGDLLRDALQRLPESIRAEIVLLVLGHGGEEIADAIQVPTVNMGYVSNDYLKSIVYSAADVFLFPTRADAFGLVAQEAAACGTPTVAFDIGGVSDIVRPGVTGYLAQPENSQDFCDGIVQLLTDDAARKRLNQQCREIVLQEYPLDLQAKRYMELYQKALTQKI